MALRGRYTRAFYCLRTREIYRAERFVRDDLAIHIDMAPASLRLAGIDIPDYLEGLDWFSEDYKERDFIVTARDRCDWTKDRIRVVRTKDHKYVRNFYPEYSYMQSNYRDEWLMVTRAKEMYQKGELNTTQARFFEPTRPAEEFYLVKDDPFEIDNQIDNPLHGEVIKKYRAILDEWILTTGDQGQFLETEVSYNEALRHVNTEGNRVFPLIAGVSGLLLDNDSASFEVYIENVTNQEMVVETRVNGTQAFSGFLSTRTVKLLPGEVFDARLISLADSPIDSDSIVVSISTSYRFNHLSSQPYHYSYTLKPIEKRSIPEHAVAVDGLLSDWEGYLAHSFGGNNRARFGVVKDHSHVYIGVMVSDPEVMVSSGKNPWEQDGIEIRVDGRPDPYRSSALGTEDFFDHLLIAMSPSADGRPKSFYFPAIAGMALPEGFFENDLQYKSRVVPGGYTAEVAIPVHYLDGLQDNWEAIRVNVIVHDKGKDGITRYRWQPAWGQIGDYAGSGTFFK
jgi:hypothetical protein